MWQFLDEFHFIRQPPFGDLVTKIGNHVSFGYIAAGFADDQQQRPLVPFRMIDAHRCRFGDAGTADSRIFQFDRADPLAAGLDHILGPVGDLHRAIGMQHRDIAGIKPAIILDGIFIGTIITVDDPRPANFQGAAGLAVARCDIAFFIDHPQFHTERRASLLADHIDLLLEIQIIPIGWQRAGRPDRRSLGHAPGMGDADAVFHQPLDHRSRTGGTADHDNTQFAVVAAIGVHVGKHRQPDRRHAGAVSHAFLANQFPQDLRIIARREDHLGANRGAGIWQAPGIGMEHRHHRQHHRASRQIHDIGLRLGDRVQDIRAMLVQHAFGISGGAACIA